MVHTGIDITPKKWTRLSKIALFHSGKDTNGLVPIEVMNADVKKGARKRTLRRPFYVKFDTFRHKK